MKPLNKKRDIVKIYKIGEDLFLYPTYNKHPTISIPRYFRGLISEPVAHTQYKGWGSKWGYITAYVIQANEFELHKQLKGTGKKLELRDVRDAEVPEDVDVRFNVRMEHTQPKALEQLVKATRHDIEEFCGRDAKNQGDTSYIIVKKINPEIKFNLINPGPFEFVVAGKGYFEDSCRLNVGIDIARGCAATIRDDFVYDSQGRCTYCYARHQNAFPVFSALYKITIEDTINRILSQLKENRFNIRIGQKTEPYIPKAFRDIEGFEDYLPTVLEAIIELQETHKIGVTMTSKLIEFDDDLAKLLREAKVSLMISVAYQELEPNIVKLGADVDTRLERALAYSEAGVNTNLFVATDVTRGFEYLQEDAKKALEFVKKHPEIGLQFLDMRITRKEDAEIIAGAPWHVLKDPEQRSLFDNPGRWHSTKQRFLAAHKIHPDFKDQVMCSTHTLEKRCGNCFMGSEVTRSSHSRS